MKLLIAQLSDIHIDENFKNISIRAEKISKSIASISHDCDKVLFCFTGDIAYSGKKNEYEIAYDFIKQVNGNLKKSINLKTSIVIIPGNHDCDFMNKGETRNLLLDNTKKLEKTLNSKIDSDLISNVIFVQENFFNFINRFDDNKVIPSLFYRKEMNLGNYKILINCINSSWISKIDEKQGELFIPVNAIKFSDGYDLIITIFHHPYKWFESENSNVFRDLVERNSDIILTGHEHDYRNYEVSKRNGEINEYFEGGILYNKSSPFFSTFNCLKIDLTNMKQRLHQFKLKGDLYENEYYDIEWKDFYKNKNIIRLEYEINERFNKFINDLGTKFIHARKEQLFVNDLFIYPQLKEVKRSAQNKINNLISSENISDHVEKYRKLILSGSEKIGKTVFGKKLFSDFRKRGLVPIFMDGEEIKGIHKSNDTIESLIKNTFIHNFNEKIFEKYKQLEKLKKVLIIDNFHKSELNVDGQSNFLEISENYFDFIYIFVDNLYKVKEFMFSEKSEAVFSQYMHFEILQMGGFAKHTLIKKWILIGQEFTINEIKLNNDINEYEKSIRLIVGKNFLPHYPLFVTIILQALETQKMEQTQQGSYGYFYEILIKDSIMKYNFSNIDLDTKFTFLSILSFECYKLKKVNLKYDEFEIIYKLYETKYKRKFNLDDLINDLTKANILDRDNDIISFKYNYIFYYFVAKYLSDNISNPDIKTEINLLCDKVYYEEYSNIILFLTHLSKDPFIINKLLENSEKYFKKYTPCKLENEVQFLNSLIDKIPNLIYLEENIEKNKEEILKQIDEMDSLESDDEENNEINLKDREEDFEFSIIREILISYRYTQILGQILKNFPGSLTGDIKEIIVKTSYDLCLKTISIYINLLNENLDKLVKDFHLFLEKKSYQDKDKIKFKTKFTQFLFLLAEIVTLSIIKNLSRSIGTNKLELIYGEVLNSDPNSAYKLINLSVNLNNSKFPDELIITLSKEFKKNIFALNILRTMVVTYLHIFPVEKKVKQKVCEKLNIKYVMNKNQ